MHILTGLKRTIRLLSPIAHSAFVQGIACLFALYLTLTLIPKHFFESSEQSSPDAEELLAKIPAYLSSPSNPDVVLMGSSLLIAPALACDKSVPGVELPPPGPTRGYRYDKAHFLKQLLEKKTGRTVEVFNLAIPATMMSDQCALLEEAFACGKKPGVIVFGLAPRDFVANDLPVPEATPIASEVSRLRRNRQGGLFNQIRRLYEGINASLESCKQKLAGGKLKLQNELLALRDGLSAAQLPETARADRLSPTAKTDSGHGNGGIGAKTAEQVTYYRRIYAPYDPKIFDKQSAYLERALKQAAANGVAVLIVNMPLSRINTALLDAEAMRRYLYTLEVMTKKYAVAYLDFGSQVEKYYSADDFPDSVHLGAAGGKRFFMALSRALTEEPVLSNKLVLLR